MMKSMTGYGSASGKCGPFPVTVEVRSVNNRFLDCTVRLPRIYAAAEEPMKSTVRDSVSRGKVDIFVTLGAPEDEEVQIAVNRPLAAAYVSAVTGLAEAYSLPTGLTALELSRMPDVLSVQKQELDADKLTAELCAVLKEALRAHDAMRSREGEKLRQDILGKADTVEKLVAVVEVRSSETIAEYQEKLLQKLREVLQDRNVDESRIVTEAAIFADKVAVDEETVRLRSHISQLRVLADSNEPVGRKLDFLVQEFNREANTIGSKCSDASLAMTVVEMKSEIEKIREQVQNVE